jgi:hypothetical protein
MFRLSNSARPWRYRFESRPWKFKSRSGGRKRSDVSAGSLPRHRNDGRAIPSNHGRPFALTGTGTGHGRGWIRIAEIELPTDAFGGTRIIPFFRNVNFFGSERDAARERRSPRRQGWPSWGRVNPCPVRDYKLRRSASARRGRLGAVSEIKNLTMRVLAASPSLDGASFFRKA